MTKPMTDERLAELTASWAEIAGIDSDADEAIELANEAARARAEVQRLEQKLRELTASESVMRKEYGKALLDRDKALGEAERQKAHNAIQQKKNEEIADACRRKEAALTSALRERDKALAEYEREKNAHAGTAASHVQLREEVDATRSLLRISDEIADELRATLKAVKLETAKQMDEAYNATLRQLKAENAAWEQQVVDATKWAEENEQAAARWRALMGIARMRIMGSAGKLGVRGEYQHLGLELWTIYPGVTPEDSAESRKQLTAVVDSLLDNSK